MAIENDDLLYVQRPEGADAGAYKIKYEDLKENIGGIEDAPSDGNQYARQDGAWAEVEGGGGDVEEAPNDGQQYARQNEAWSVVQSGDVIYQGAAAWGDINDDGTILGGLNVASVVRTPGGESAGDWTVTFANPMPNINYAVTTGGSLNNISAVTKTVNGFRVQTANNADVLADSFFYFAVHALNALPPMGGTGTDAWGVFDGSDPGTIQGSFNIASITRNSVGNYSVVFTNPMPDTQYAVVGSCWNAAADTAYTFLVTNKSSTGFDYVTLRDVGQAGDGTISYSDQAASFTVNGSNATLPLTITEDQIAALIQNPALSAWAHVDMNADGSNIQVNGSFNVKEVTRSAQGNFTVVFDNDIPGDYSVTCTSMEAGGVTTVQNTTAANCQVLMRTTDSTPFDGGFYIQIAGTARNGTLGGGADAWGSIAQNGDKEGTFNVADVVFNSAGNYTVSFTNPMPNANYSVVATPTTGGTRYIGVNNKTVNGFDVVTYNDSNTSTSSPFSFAVFATDGNAGGFWVKTDDELAPLSATDGVKIGGGAINLDPASQVKSEVPFWYDSTLPKAFNNTAFQASGTDGIGAIVSSNGTHLIGGDLDKPFGSMSPNITLNADGSGTFAGQGTFGTPSVDEGALISDEGFISLRKDGALYSSFNIYNGSFDNAGRKVSINNDGSATFAGNIDAGNVFFSLDDGSTFAVKDRILNLISRLDAIEANEQIDDATDTSLLQLVANASSRLDSIEARLSALEGGN